MTRELTKETGFKIINHRLDFFAFARIARKIQLNFLLMYSIINVNNTYCSKLRIISEVSV